MFSPTNEGWLFFIHFNQLDRPEVGGFAAHQN
jgi:hypothetical protein